MVIRNWMHIIVMLALAALVSVLAACGGGSDATTTPIDNTIDNGNGNPLPNDIDGPTVYPGQPGDDTNPIVTPIDPDPVVNTPFRFGDNIFEVPLDTNGAGRVVCSNFQPGQRIAFVVVNLNPIYLDAHLIQGSGFPRLPESSFSVYGDLVQKGVSMTPPVPATESLGLGGTTGLASTGELQNPQVIYEREAAAQGLEPYAAIPPSKSVSVIQKGELRWFIYVPPRGPSWPPRAIPPNPEDPEQDTSDFQWPPGYNCQAGRLVAIGAHCLVFLSHEINNGHPDTIQFTEARLNRLAREFDTKIFPTATAAYGPVVSYREDGVMNGIDRDLVITGADYSTAGEYIGEAPGWLDNEISQEQKILIFLMNGEAGGFYVGASRTSETEWGDPHSVGSTIYIGSDNFPANDNAWEEGYSVMAHEFQHKLYNDHGLPSRPVMGAGGNYNWLNEGLSQMDIHLCGYTVNSGKIIPWAIDGQLTDYLHSVQRSAVCMDGNDQFSQQTQYGNGFLFFLYMYEHYDPGVGNRIYALAKKGENDYIKLIEAGAQYTVTTGPGLDGVTGTADDVKSVYHETFDQLYTKFLIANFIDGIYKDEYSDLFDERFRYDTIDLRGTINLTSGTIVLPGVNTAVFPDTGGYPVQAIDRRVIPWAADYFVFSNGDGRDLEVTLYSDPYFKIFMLPVGYNEATNKVDITPGIVLNY